MAKGNSLHGSKFSSRAASSADGSGSATALHWIVRRPTAGSLSVAVHLRRGQRVLNPLALGHDLSYRGRRYGSADNR
jgi:hypothetical protein